MYIDEFAMFATNSVDTMLSEARKYRLNLILAMQYFDQLETRILGSVLANVGNLDVFRVGAKDAAILAREFAPVFSAENLAIDPVSPCVHKDDDRSRTGKSVQRQNRRVTRLGLV